MPLTLHLGVVEFSYSHEPPSIKKVAKVHKGKQKIKAKRISAPQPGGQTTGDVASILEAKYNIMGIFYDLHEQEIADLCAEAMGGALEDLMAGAPPTRDPLAPAMSEVVTKFHTFIDMKEMDDTGTPGVPTRAARQGVTSRRKGQRGPPRPSFQDTALYEGSFLAWMD